MSARPELAFHPRGSWLHRVGPAPKLVWLGAILLAALLTADPTTLLVYLTLALLVTVTARAAEPALRGLVILMPPMAVLILLEATVPAACGGPCTPLGTLGPVSVSAEGLWHGLALAARLAVMELAVVSLAGTIHPADLLASLSAARVPFPVAFRATMLLRALSTLDAELRATIAALRSRGLRVRGHRAILAAIRPAVAELAARSRRADIALQARGVALVEAKTSWRGVVHGPRERRLSLAGVAVGVLLCAWGLAIGRGGGPVVPPPVAAAVVAGALAALIVSAAWIVAAVERA
jgi:energy-coupling factor transporter transmembrane protein EcfT